MRTRPIVAAALAGLAAVAVAGPAVPAGAVTFVSGEATRRAGGEAEALAPGSPVQVGDVLETARRTRLEVRLGDGSALRLGPSSRAVVAQAAFGNGAGERTVRARLAVGKVWANVAKAVGGAARFEVQTENAVAGVRGTTFRVDAATDRSVVVKVYSGSVAVAGGKVPRPEHAPPGERRQVAGPREVSREEWERIVTSMMEVRVSAAGVPAEPAPFQLAKAGADEWEEWNRSRDAAR